MGFGSEGRERHTLDIPESSEDGLRYSDPIIETMLGVLKQEAKRLLLAYELRGETYVGTPLPQASSRAILVEAFRILPEGLATPLRAAVDDLARWELSRVSQEMVGGHCMPRTNALKRGGHCLSEAVIVYKYGETVDDPIYMAHELGHLVSDDLLNAAGFNYLAAPEHIVEIPAFFAQHLMYEFLMHHGPRHLRPAASAHFRKEMREQLIDIAIGASARDAAATRDQGTESAEVRFRTSMQSWLGDVWRNCARAVQIANQISNPEIRAETENVFLHKHATSSIFAAALFETQKIISPSARMELLETMFGAKGPYTAGHLLRIVDASDSTKLAALILSATQAAVSRAKQAEACNADAGFDFCPG